MARPQCETPPSSSSSSSSSSCCYSIVWQNKQVIKRLTDQSKWGLSKTQERRYLVAKYNQPAPG